MLLINDYNRETMINHLLRTTLFCFACLAAFMAPAQNSSMEYLEKQFPKLTSLFREELEKTATHYIIAVDVSGSMVKYNNLVTPMLQAFAMALPDGEQVSVIPFGTDAKENTPGLCNKMESDAQRQILCNALSSLYINESYTPEFKRNTDINKAVSAINKAILNNKNVDMNVVIIITDFLNDLPGKGEIKLTKENIETLSNDFNNLTDNTYTRVVAMRLPKAGTGAGYSLDQLQEGVFNAQTPLRRFESVDAINDEATIQIWFDQLTRDIMTDKLRGVIRLYNEREICPSLTAETDIDGNVTAEFDWKPNKLYNSLQLGKTTTLPGSEFYVDCDTASTITINGNSSVKLGQIKHGKWAFHNFDEDLNVNLELPTDFDDELQTLSIRKPFSDTVVHQNRWIWVFILSFLTTCILAALLIIYIVAVLKAINRNRRERIKGRVLITNEYGEAIGEPIKVACASGKSLNIGASGTNGCNVPGAEWNISLTKVKSNPFLFWTKPKFRWEGRGPGQSKVINSRKNRSGNIGRYGTCSKQVNLDCYDSNGNHTNTVKITLSSDN